MAPDHGDGDRGGGIGTVPYVLMYHSVERYEEDPYLVTVTPRLFDRQLRWMRDRRLRGTSVRELLDAAAVGEGRGLVGLTFDDGYADFAAEVVPALRRHGFSATVFVIAGRIGGSNEWDPEGPRKALMTADQVRDVARAGMEIGSHGLRHTRLPAVGDAELREEVESSRSILEDVAGEPVRGFCYPYGEVSDRVVEAVRTSGYTYGCAIGRSSLMGRHALPRTYIGDRDGPLRLRAKRMRHLMAGR